MLLFIFIYTEHKFPIYLVSFALGFNIPKCKDSNNPMFNICVYKYTITLRIF